MGDRTSDAGLYDDLVVGEVEFDAGLAGCTAWPAIVDPALGRATARPEVHNWGAARESDTGLLLDRVEQLGQDR